MCLTIALHTSEGPACVMQTDATFCTVSIDSASRGPSATAELLVPSPRQWSGRLSRPSRSSKSVQPVSEAVYRGGFAVAVVINPTAHGGICRPAVQSDMLALDR